MSGAAQVDPQGKMRARNVNKVARGEQAPTPAHQYSHVDRTPSPPIDNKDNLDDKEQFEQPGTAAAHLRFPSTNQTRHCFTRDLEHRKCMQEKGENAPECKKFAKYYRSLCPVEWIERWME